MIVDPPPTDSNRETRSNSECLERIQRRAARTVTRQFSWHTSVTSILETLKWPRLQLRRLSARLSLFYRGLNGLAELSCVNFVTRNKRSTRGNSAKFKICHCRTLTHKGSFIPSCVKEWNNLPQSVVSSTSLCSFKTSLSDYLDVGVF